MRRHLGRLALVIAATLGQTRFGLATEPPLPPPSAQIHFSFVLCNRTSADMWVAVGLPTYQSDTEPMIRGWATIAPDKCIAWPGYYLKDPQPSRRMAYFYAETLPEPRLVLTHPSDAGPVKFCIGQGHEKYSRINTPGYQCAANERALDFWRVPLGDGSTTFEIGGWARDECAPPVDADYVMLDGEIAVRARLESDAVDFKANAGSLFVLESIRRQAARWALQIHVDDALEWVVIPPEQLSLVRFFRTNSEMIKGISTFGYPDTPFPLDTDIGIIPCTSGARRDHAQGLFRRAFERLQANDLAAAQPLFLDGLRIDSRNAAALFYYAETKRLARDDENSWAMLALYRRAHELGLDDNNDAVAQEQIRRLRKAVGDDN